MLRLKQEVEPSLQRSLMCRLQKCHDSPSFISPSKYIWQICKHYKNMQNCKTGLQIDVRSPLSSPFFIQWELPRERQEEIFVSWKHKMQEIYHLCAKPQWVVAEKIQ